MSKLNVTTSTTRPASPNTGSIFFESDTNKLIFWDGSVWHLFDRDSVTAAAPANTLTFDLSFEDSDQGFSDTNLTFSSDSSVTAADVASYGGATPLSSYSAQSVGDSTKKIFAIWEDAASFSGGGSSYAWAGWSLFWSDDDGSTLNRVLYNYMGSVPMPYVLISTDYTLTSWDHNIQAPFNLDLASADGSGSDWVVTYDGNGTGGDGGDVYELAWDTGGGFGMGAPGGNMTAQTFISSRAGSIG